MKSPVANHAGNVNLKGKKYKLMSCKCCLCIDFRDKLLNKEHMKEMNGFRRQIIQD